MKNKKLIYILTACLVVVIAVVVVSQLNISLSPKTQEDIQAERIILSYIEAKGLDIRPGTEEYSRLMRGILLGEVPELTGEESVFVHSPEEKSRIIGYAARNFKPSRMLLRGWSEDTDIREVPTPPPEQ